MGRRKKEEIIENPVEMKEDAMNPPIQAELVGEKNEEPVVEKNSPVFKKVSCNANYVNVRDGENGQVMFTIKNNSKIIVESEANGWCKISGYVMSELVKEL